MCNTIYLACIDCDKEKKTPKAQRVQRCLSCKNRAVAKNKVYHACPDCGKPKKDRGRSDRVYCRSCAGKRRWQEPEFREKIFASFESEKYKIERPMKVSLALSKPESKVKQSAASKASWTEDRKERYSIMTSRNARERWRRIYDVEKWEDIPRDYDGAFTERLRKSIRDRHGNKCAICGCMEEKNGLDVHHIDYDKQNSVYTNLIALCHGCHTRTNHRRNFWQELFTTYMRNIPFEVMTYVRAVM